MQLRVWRVVSEGLCVANNTTDRQSGLISSLSLRWLHTHTHTHTRCDNPRSAGNPRLQPNFFSQRTKVLSTPIFFPNDLIWWAHSFPLPIAPSLWSSTERLHVHVAVGSTAHLILRYFLSTAVESANAVCNVHEYICTLHNVTFCSGCCYHAKAISQAFGHGHTVTPMQVIENRLDIRI